MPILLFALGWILCSHGRGAETTERAATATDQRGGVTPPNFLLITADDLNWSSVGAYGCPVPNITPNIDRLAAEGLRFLHAHVSAAICQPSRQALMTGRYPHQNSRGGFHPIRDDVPTLQEQLHAAGYLNGILGKVPHLAPQRRFCWDDAHDAGELGRGRDPKLYYQRAREFLERARAEGKRFFLMANSHDPHRPFAGSEQERPAGGKGRGAPFPGVRRTLRPEEVSIPGFLPDIPDVRQEVAQYFTSVFRCDETVGQILRALRETGFERDTLVMFLSDNGMAFPFAKANCYLNSTRTPWIVRWPGRVKAGTSDETHLIGGIDFMPTVLEAAGLPPVSGMAGRSFLPILRGESPTWRRDLVTEINYLSSGRAYPMRCVLDGKFGYLFNAWSDGQWVYRNESQSGLTFKAMQAAAAGDQDIAARVKLFQYRVKEELYDFAADADGRRNLVGEPQYQADVRRLRQRLIAHLQDTEDPQYEPLLELSRRAEGAPRND